ncbi:MAG: preprotein translocase subunit YajC [Kocuria sp.]|nr:preprotein translocase subunit YajC [Kocuria sp.]
MLPSVLSAQTETQLLAAEQSAGGSGQFLFFAVMMGLLLLMFWFTSRGRRRQQQKLKEQQSQMVPGTEVMTSYGLYGRVVSIDREAVKAVLEIAPGTQVTVHLQTVSTVVEGTTADVTNTRETDATDSNEK